MMVGMTTEERTGDSVAQRGRVTLGIEPRDAARFVVSWVRSTPGTHIWLLILAVSSVILATVSEPLREFLLHHNSTNVVELRLHPLRVLIVSALWIETPPGYLVYVLLYELVHAPIERRLGTGRWLIVAVTAHIGATLISEHAVSLAIRYSWLPRSMAHTVDIGVSYGLAGVAGVMTYFVPGPWRWLYLALSLGFFAVPLVSSHTFTDLGHFCALLIGLACHALTPGGIAAPKRPRFRRPHSSR
jgi:hypothetical protein